MTCFLLVTSLLKNTYSNPQWRVCMTPSHAGLSAMRSLIRPACRPVAHQHCSLSIIATCSVGSMHALREPASTLLRSDDRVQMHVCLAGRRTCNSTHDLASVHDICLVPRSGCAVKVHHLHHTSNIAAFQQGSCDSMKRIVELKWAVQCQVLILQVSIMSRDSSR